MHSPSPPSTLLGGGASPRKVRPMTIAYFDCFSGASGDMIVGALLDAGADFEALKARLASLGVPGCELRAEKVRRKGMAGTKFHVDTHAHPHSHDHEHKHEHAEAHSHRHLGDIIELIDKADLAPRAADRAKRIFARLADAEARVHGVGREKVHFHEVGAADSIMDVVGACVALELLGVDEVFSSPIPVGSGRVECEHGTMPVPAPATAELLVGAMTTTGNAEGEITTPTGAAVLTTLAEAFGPIPAMAVSAVGLGAGTRDDTPLPNLLRVFIGAPADGANVETVMELSVNLDDCTGEVVGRAIGRLLSAGCLDAWATPIVMKKSRPAWTLSALCELRDVGSVEKLLFAETTTFGIRRRPCRRSRLERRFETVETPFGPIRVKVGRLGGRTVTASPEFDDCAAAADAHHVGVREVQAAAEQAYRRKGCT